jgi:RNA polymerase sigma-70 factor (family 1)
MALYSTLTDGDLVSLLQKSDEKAFTEIYIRYRGSLSAYAFNFCGNREDALDVAQDLFASIWNLRHQLNISHSLRAYLYQSVRNGCLQKLEKTGKHNALLNNLATRLTNEDLSLNHHLDAKDFSNKLSVVINNMPDKMQQVFRMSREEGLTHAEIGEKLDISPLTVKTHVQNALKLIRSHVGKVSGWLLLLLSDLFN